ncbi:hypothetical protein TELCIR_14197 [Teladorsagia circumcincta]|uniref:Uncharacterized protein n=1 Tax=Teladorsagia circumcincta TaxID=45464 RepID=A0A2G9U1X1_TELCI|nr:hypothetical protein TELCIR_14197 [Teladorsagia circumcincta]
MAYCYTKPEDIRSEWFEQELSALILFTEPTLSRLSHWLPALHNILKAVATGAEWIIVPGPYTDKEWEKAMDQIRDIAEGTVISCEALKPRIKILLPQNRENCSCDSTLAYQFKGFRRQTSLSDFETLCLPATIVKMFNEPIVLLVEVFDNGILPYADEGSEVVPVDGCPGALLPELCCSLNTHREVKSCAEETMVSSRVELRNNSDVGQTKPSIEDDVTQDS